MRRILFVVLTAVALLATGLSYEAKAEMAGQTAPAQKPVPKKKILAVKRAKKSATPGTASLPVKKY